MATTDDIITLKLFYEIVISGKYSVCKDNLLITLKIWPAVVQVLH